jgi:hypothetical protein
MASYDEERREVRLTQAEYGYLQDLLYSRRVGILGDGEIASPIMGTHDDSLDATNPFEFYFYVPEGTVKILEFRLRFWLQKFRAYSKTAAAGGGTTATSGASSATTTGGGGGATATSGASSATTTGGGGTTATDYAGGNTSLGYADLALAGTGNTGSAGTGNTGSAGPNTHGPSAYAYDHYHTQPSHTHTGPSHTHTGPSHTHTDNGHTHYMTDHRHTLGTHTHGMAHTHDVTLADHTHGMAHTHDVTLTDHTHTAVYGIYEGTSATGVTVTINGVDRTAALGGGAGFTTDQEDLDIASYLTMPGKNTISLTSTQLGRITAQWDGMVTRSLLS